MAERISQNFIKKTLQLLKGKGRGGSGLFIAEGEKFALEIPKGWRVEHFIASDGFAQKHDMSAYESKARVYIAAGGQYKRLSGTVEPQGIMAVCEKRACRLEGMINKKSLILMCEALADPGNVGALIRTACAAGASGVVLTQGCADLYSPKVVRATAGAMFHIHCAENVEAAPAARLLKSHGAMLAAAHLKGGISPYEVDLAQPCCIMIGNEARGLSAELTGLADVLIKLPMSPASESLNAAAAGSILLYEALRQRLL